MTAAITERELLARLTLPDEEFLESFVALIGNVPAREWTREAFERGLRYPWYRPERSYLLRGEEVTLLDELPDDARATVLEASAQRVALVAIGANAAPKNLAIKLAHLEPENERTVLVLAGELHEVDVVATASVTVYGAMPATLAASPGTAVRVAAMLVTERQLNALAFGEMPYRLGRLTGAPFTVEDGVDSLAVHAPLAFVSRWGAFAPEGQPLALAAVPAASRRFPALTQAELVGRAAQAVGFGSAEELTRAIFADAGGMARRNLRLLAALAAPTELPGWVPMAPDGTFPAA